MPEYLDTGTMASWHAGEHWARSTYAICSRARRLLHADRIFDIVSSSRVTRLTSPPNMKCEAGGVSRRRAYRPPVSRVRWNGGRL